MKRYAALIAASSLCSGCALTTTTIDIPYQSVAQAIPVPGASAATIAVTSSDARTIYADRVGTKKNGYGMEMAAIVPDRPIPETLREAVSREMAARGFRVAAAGMAAPGTVQVEVVRFYNDFKPGFFSGDAVANVAFNIRVLHTGQPSTFSKYYEGVGTEPNIQIMGGDNARAGLAKAFAGAVNSAVNDEDFLRAALSAGGGALPPVPPSERAPAALIPDT